MNPTVMTTLVYPRILPMKAWKILNCLMTIKDMSRLVVPLTVLSLIFILTET